MADTYPRALKSIAQTFRIVSFEDVFLSVGEIFIAYLLPWLKHEHLKQFGRCSLIGGLVAIFWIFPYIGFLIQLTFIFFQRGGPGPPVLVI